MRCEFCGLLLSFLFENIFEDSNLLADVCGKLICTYVPEIGNFLEEERSVDGLA
jgi:hypothetical protein